MIKICEYCGEQFSGCPSRLARKKTCSKECTSKLREQIKRKKAITKKCLICGSSFETTASQIKHGRGKYCSRKCLYISSRKKVILTCVVCKKQFEVWPCYSHRKHCSRKCYLSNMKGENNPAWNGGRITKTCIVCKKQYQVSPHLAQQESQRCCSRECQSEWQRKNRTGKNGARWEGGLFSIICKQCGKRFEVKRKRKGTALFCSSVCYGESISGELSPMWRDGGSILYPPHWTEKLRRSIRERDSNICQVCGGAIPTGDVHHIDYNKENCKPYNLITLCQSCHGKTNHNRHHWQQKLESMQQKRL